MSDLPIAIVGAGAAGLCAAWAACERGLSPVIFDRSRRVGGAWVHMPPTMRCLSPRRHDVLSDGSAPVGPGTHALASEVLAAIERFARRTRCELRLGIEVTDVQASEDTLLLRTSAGPVGARRLIIAGGEYEAPFTPSLPGSFAGRQWHARRFDATRIHAGERVAVIGAGNSAADVVVALSERHVHVILAARRPPRRPTRAQLIHNGGSRLSQLAFRVSGLPLRWLPFQGGCQRVTPLFSPVLYEAVRNRTASLVEEVVALETDAIVTRSGRREVVDCIVFATGYQRDNNWLRGLLALDERGFPRHRDGISVEHSAIGFVGLPCMRTRRSGFLRGFADDARSVVGRLVE